MTTTTPIPTWPTSDHLTVLPIERADQAVEPHRLFRLLILSRGKLTALLDGEPMEMNAPCVLCLHERRRLTCTRMIHCEGLVLLFRPAFLNRSFTLETLRHPHFQSLAEKHSFFQLRPFLSDKKQVERWFQAYKGMTYYQYVKELRLKKVCFYLRFTELQMKEIAVRVGFSSAQNLARFFQKEKRMSMSAFRRQSVWERQNDRELQAIRSSHTA